MFNKRQISLKIDEKERNVLISNLDEFKAFDEFTIHAAVNYFEMIM